MKEEYVAQVRKLLKTMKGLEIKGGCWGPKGDSKFPGRNFFIMRKDGEIVLVNVNDEMAVIHDVRGSNLGHELETLFWGAKIPHVRKFYSPPVYENDAIFAQFPWVLLCPRENCGYKKGFDFDGETPEGANVTEIIKVWRRHQQLSPACSRISCPTIIRSSEMRKEADLQNIIRDKIKTS